MTRLSGKLVRVARDREGAVVLESIITFLPLLLFFLGLCQTADAYAHHLIVRRAASAAARAAVVVLPDDGIHYRDPQNRGLHRASGERLREIETAAKTILDASSNLAQGQRVRVSGRLADNQPVTVSVSADYECLLGWISLVCGRTRKLTLRASATLPYQGAPYRY